MALPEKAQALDRFSPTCRRCAGSAALAISSSFREATLGALAEIYGLSIAPDAAGVSLADHLASELKRPAKAGDAVPLGPIALVAHRVSDGRATSVGLRLADAEEDAEASLTARCKRAIARLWSRLG